MNLVNGVNGSTTQVLKNEKVKSKFVNNNDTHHHVISNNNDNTHENMKESTLSKKFKSFPSNKEREFLNYYNNIDELVKEKDIKYVSFIGKKLLTDSEILDIVNERNNILNTEILNRRKIDMNRFIIETDTDKCLVKRNDNELLLKSNFSFNLNDKFFKSRYYFSLFLKMMTKVLIRNRAEKRLQKILLMIKRNNIKNSKDFGEYVEREWQEYSMKDNTGDVVDINDNNNNEIKLKFIPLKAVSRSVVYISNDYNLEALKQVMNHENNINLEELKEFNKLERNDMEVLGYKGTYICFK